MHYQPLVAARLMDFYEVKLPFRVLSASTVAALLVNSGLL
jgi:hypothetical protein